MVQINTIATFDQSQTNKTSFNGKSHTGSISKVQNKEADSFSFQGCAHIEATKILNHKVNTPPRNTHNNFSNIKNTITKMIGRLKQSERYIVKTFGEIPTEKAELEKFVKLRTKKDGITPLIAAAKYGDNRLVKKFLKNGADINAQDALLKTSLHKAAGYGNAKTVKILLEQGADKTLRDNCGRLPIHEAASNGLNDVIDVFLKHGDDIDAVNKNGQTSLHMVSGWDDNIETAKFLLDKGANYNAMDKNKKTPIDESIRFACPKTTELLKSRGAKTGEDLIKKLAI